jgi:hypothetical protein
MARIEICFQIDEDVLVTALTEIRQCFSQFDSPFEEVHSLLNRVGGADRFNVEPGCEDSSDDLDEEEDEDK